MQSNPWIDRVHHILESIDKIQRYTDGMTFTEFASNQLAVDAVIRRFEIIGEASRRIPDDVIARYGDIPWTTFREFPIGLPHRCIDNLRLESIWKSVQIDLPSLIPRLNAIQSDTE